jgi:hypothetical protein
MGQNLTPLPFTLNGYVPTGSAFADHSGDQPSTPTNTLTYTLNLTRCYASLGVPVPAAPVIGIWAHAISSNYPDSGPAPNARSEVWLRLEP